MKKNILFIAVALLGGINAFSQNCVNYLLLQNNKKIEVSIYNKKGKDDGKQVWDVSAVRTANGVTKATVKSEFFNKDGKSINKATNDIQCKGGALQMNMKMMLSEDQMKAWGENATVTATGEFLEYPPTIAEGGTLPDGNLHMDIKTEQGMNISVDLQVTDRLVLGKESITSPAGTWECFKISSKQRIVSKVAGIGIPFKIEVKEWFAPGEGVIKTESKYGSTLVTSIQ